MALKKQSKKAQKSSRTKKFKDWSNIDQSDLSIEISQLRYGEIKYCDVDKIKLPDGELTIEKSWIELVLRFVSAYILGSENFKREDVIIQDIFIDKLYGIHNFSKPYDVYEVPGTGYYIEAIFNEENIYKILITFAEKLGYNLSDIIIHIVNRNYVDEDLQFEYSDNTDRDVKTIDLNYLLENFEKEHLVAVKIGDTAYRVHQIELLLYYFAIEVYNRKDIFTILSTTKFVGNTGFALEGSRDIQSQKICDSALHIFTDGNKHDIINFMQNSIAFLGLGCNFVSVNIKHHKEHLKEYEI